MAPQKNASLQQNPSRYNIIAGLLFVVLILYQLFLILRDPDGNVTLFWNWKLYRLLNVLPGQYKIAPGLIVPFIVTAVGLFTKKKSMVAIGFGFLAVISLFSMVIQLNFEAKLKYILPALIDFTGYLFAFLISLVTFSDKKMGKRILFIPVLLIAISFPCGYVASGRSGLYMLRLEWPYLWYHYDFEREPYVITIRGLVCAVAVLFALLWITYPYKKSAASPVSANINSHTGNF